MKKQRISKLAAITVAKILVLTLLFTLVINAQKQNSKAAQNLATWQNRVNSLTDDVIDDTKMVGNSDRALYRALLAKIWWKHEPAEAERYLKRSLSYLVSEAESDEKAGAAKRAETIRKVVRITGSLDEKLARSTAEKIAKIIESKGGSEGNADLFAELGLQTVDRDLNLGFGLGVTSLRFGTSMKIPDLISKLYPKDPKRGDDLFMIALASAKRNYTYEFTGRLGFFAFDPRYGASYSDAARRSYLETLAGMIAVAASTEPGKAEACGVVALLSPLLPKYDELLPSLSPVVRQHVDLCLPFAHPFTAELTKAEARGGEPQTVEELLEAWKASGDRALKSRYFSQAIRLLGQAKKFDEIISLLDAMTEDEIKTVGSVAWDSWRLESAYGSALGSFTGKDLASMYSMIDHSPKRLRPYVRFRLIYKLSPMVDRDIIFENLEQIRKELETFEIPPKDAASNYLTLSRLYLKFQPSESEKIFATAVKAINEADRDNPDSLPEKDFAALDDHVPIPAALLETDEYAVNRSLANIGSKQSRIRLRLGLLESSLKEFADAKTKVLAENKKEESR